SGLIGRAEMKVETGAGVLDLVVHARGGAAERVTVAMGVPELRPERIPVAVAGERAFDLPLDGVGAEVVVDCVSMGNPHAVMFLDRPVADFPLESVGPRVERHPLFPRRVNSEIVSRRGRGELDARVWGPGAERRFLVGVVRPNDDGAWPIEDSLHELTELAQTAGARVSGSTSQRLRSPNPKTFIGAGKVEELRQAKLEQGIDLFIFDDEL